ncbi:MAG: Colicin V production protein [Parcubacteria group bacterium GW2011_GWE2_38_18]|nr:MAG: Colicin V production protein [Parcubacteria group bacterium GW2011_GWE2_38_18]
MVIFDIGLIIILAGFVFYGLFFGLIRTIGALLGMLIGIWVAGMYYVTVAGWFKNLFFGYDSVGKLITFLVIFILVSSLIKFAFMMLDKAFDFLAIIPFLKTINRLAGAVFGLVLGGFMLGFVFYIFLGFPIVGTLLGKLSANSKVVPYLLKFVEILKPFLPEVLKRIKLLGSSIKA